jgi:extracellular factor (EF) 3-hydroxypalmitic acid methyl ester biosynthesis protein
MNQASNSAMKLSISFAVASDIEAQIRISETNHSFLEAGRRFWGEGSAGRAVAQVLFQQFGSTAAALEARGWSAEKIHEHLRPAREVFAMSSFMARCQQWPRGYAGDFETIEYLAAGRNQSAPGSLGWHFEELLLHSPIVQQHRNKLNRQSMEIACTLTTSRTARVLSIGCGGCLDWVPILPCLEDFGGEIVLNDSEPDALELAVRRLRSSGARIRSAPGNVLRVAKRLGRSGRFDLILAGGLFDYLPHNALIYLLRTLSEDLITPRGVLLFTNMAEGNPWRMLMEYGATWTLIERSEAQIRELCREAGIASSCISVERDATGLALITRVQAHVTSRSARRGSAHFAEAR